MLYLKAIIFTILQFCMVRSEQVPDFVYQVLITGYGAKFDDVCGAALVDYQWAATSYKCVDNLFRKYQFIKVIGGFSRKHGGFRENRNATGYVQNHEDIALVKVDRPFDPADDLRLARLPQKNKQICKKPTTRRMLLTSEPSNHFTEYTMVNVKSDSLRILGLDHSKTNKNRKKRSLVNLVFPPEYSMVKTFGKRRRKRNSNSLFSANVENVLPQTCGRNQGWPIFCDDVIVGIETNCMSGKSSLDVVTYANVSSSVDFIETIVIESVENVEKKSEGCYLHEKNYGLWKLVLLILTISSDFLFF